MRVVVGCAPCRARIVVILSLVGYFMSRSFSWYLLVPSMMKIATSRDLLRWLAGHRFGLLCGLVASGHSEFACRWHVHSTADTWNKISASSALKLKLVGARTHIELAWPNGPMVAVGHVHRNNKPIHCP